MLLLAAFRRPIDPGFLLCRRFCRTSTIRVWETQTWGCEKLLEDHGGPVYALTVLEGKLVSAPSGVFFHEMSHQPLFTAVLFKRGPVYHLTILEGKL